MQEEEEEEDEDEELEEDAMDRMKNELNDDYDNDTNKLAAVQVGYFLLWNSTSQPLYSKQKLY